MIKDNYIKQQKILFWIIGISFILLLVANTLAWIFLNRLKSHFIIDLKSRIEKISLISSKLFDSNDIGLFVPGDEDNPAFIYYQSLLIDIKENNDLQNIYVISPVKELLLYDNTYMQFSNSIHSIDDTLLYYALRGEVTSSEILTLGSHKFLISIAPIITGDNRVVGLLVTEARAVFFQILEKFNRGLLVFNFISAFVIIIAGLLLFHSIRKIIVIQEQIKNQENLAKLGEMAASVAHEIRNPLGIIKGTNAIIQKKYGNPDDEFFTYIPAELDRLNKLITDFLTFARPAQFIYQNVSIIELLKKIKLGISGKKDIKIHLEIPDNFPVLKTAPDALEQIFLNIIMNSYQAFERKGNIRIHAYIQNNEVIIDITDNGPGISTGDLKRVFEPFFTTKEQGSGLGLSISKILTEQIGGNISIQSKINQGTTVTIILPFTRDE